MKKQFRYCWKSCTLISCYQVSIILASTILFMIGLRRAGIKNWVKYAILRVQISTPYTYASVKTRLNVLVLLLNISHIPVRKIYFPVFKECARFTLTTKRDKKQRLWSREWYVYQQQLYSHDHTTRNISYPKKGTLHQLTDFYLILTLAQSWDKVKGDSNNNNNNNNNSFIHSFKKFSNAQVKFR